MFKVYAVYPTPFWREDGLNGQAGSDRGPVKVTFDNTPPGYDRGILMGFIEAEDGRRWARRTAEERRAAVVDCFVRYFGSRAAEPLEYVERDWMAEEFSRGCYGAHFAPGVWTGFGPALREPVGRLHWAGAECSRLHGGCRPLRRGDRREVPLPGDRLGRRGHQPTTEPASYRPAAGPRPADEPTPAVSQLEPTGRSAAQPVLGTVPSTR